MTSTKKTNPENNTKKRQPKKPKKITADYLHNSGLYYLQRYASSKNHFHDVMARKAKRSCMFHKDQDYNKCLELIAELVDKFEKVGLLDDKSFAFGLATSYRRRGLSTRMAMQKMKMKGLPEDHIQSALLEVDQHNNTSPIQNPELRAALTFARKKRLGIYYQGEEERRPAFDKTLARFARAGFSYDIARKILEMDDESELE